MSIPTPGPADNFSVSTPAKPEAPSGYPYQTPNVVEEGGKSFIVTWLLSWFLGGLGIDRFYLGKVGSGVAKLLTFGGLGIWVIIDIILVLAGAQRDKAGRRLAGYEQHKKIAWIITLAVVALGILTSAFIPKGSAVDATVQPAVTQQQIVPTENAAAGSIEKPEATKEVPAVAPAVTKAAPKAAKAAPKAEPAVPVEFRSALKKAQTYSDMMHMSKVGLYEQLTSEYGEKFSPEAGQYAVDNVKADFKVNALEKAKNYQETMAMSPEGIRDQLVSEYGEKFTPEEADYAIQNLS
ncbi:Ltp family lipoprotein [Arthrobacter sp.]|uniref:Ltp family lipoprotein n=1 Tax=Arthrobacter sp. TaxID=1667 RepID=UPI0026E015C5|nr:Ltp family lipoprotein [Arthrobacter sp.]MDO5754502.1 Ltp family lipoprotein [Arthrobacter sp.]